MFTTPTNDNFYIPDNVAIGLLIECLCGEGGIGALVRIISAHPN